MNQFIIPSSKRNVNKVLLSWGCLAVAVVLVSRPCSSGQRLIEMRGWSLPQFVAHLESRNLPLSVVPTHKSGTWSNSIFLTNRKDATWQSLQAMNRTVDNIDDWRGIVLVERLSDKPGPQWNVAEWGKHGMQIDRFVLFGDADLLKQISDTTIIPQPTCVIRRWLTSL